nr:A24 family peptidase [Kitasatospora sp. MMS16-BH015]
MVVLAVAGAVLGVLLRGVVLRLAVPEGEAWQRGCPSCGGPVRPVPLPYRCPHCRARLGPVPLVLEGTLALALGGLAAERSGWELATAAALFTLLVPLALVDLRVHRLPDPLTLPAYALTLGLLAIAGTGWGSWVRALLGGLALAGCYLLLVLISPEGMGPGDLKLALPLGTVLGWYGWPVLFQGGFLGFLLGALYGLPLLLLRRGRTLAFGPFMIAGAWLALLAA